jgi:hypothetical protein
LCKRLRKPLGKRVRNAQTERRTSVEHSLGPPFAKRSTVRKTFAHLVIGFSLVSIRCAAPDEDSSKYDEEDVVTESSSPIVAKCALNGEECGTDTLPTGCNVATFITPGGAHLYDEINTATDVDAFKWTSDGSAHNYRVRVIGESTAAITCRGYYWNNASSIWSQIAAASGSFCDFTIASSSVQTYCVRIFGNDYASLAPIDSSVGKTTTSECGPAPHYGLENGVCKPSCGVLGGNYAPPNPCSNYGAQDMGDAYDVPYCCRL